MSATTPERCREVFDGLVGQRSGIIRKVQLIDTIDGDADLCHAAASLANPHAGWNVEISLAAGGSGRTREDAVMAALCEGFERYSASSYDRSQGGLVAKAALGQDTIPAAELAQFSAAQRALPGFPFQPVTADTPLRWLDGSRLVDDSRCRVPAAAVYLPYRPESGEPLVAPGISTGLSCATSVEAAVVGGMCEVIERDALAVVWLAGLSPPQISEDWFQQQAADLLPPADQAVAYDLTSDVGLPVVLVVCRGQGPRGPLLSVGSACHIDPRRATRKAALEASQDRVFVRQLLEQDPQWQPREDFSNLSDFSLHARLYSARPDLADEASGFLRGNPAPSALPSREGPEQADVLEDRRSIARQLQNAGHTGAWVDLTPVWATNLGLHVVKVIVPSLLPLHGHHLLAHLGHPRLADRHRAMPGCTRNHRRQIWPFPHPFP